MASLLPLADTLGAQRAAHLIRRASYHYTPARVDSYANMSAAQAVDDLFSASTPTLNEPIDPSTGQHFINSGVEPGSGSSNLRDYITGWWIHEASLDASIAHKMQFFLHSIFVISFDSMDQYRSVFDYLALLKQYATGNYRVLAKKMTLDNAMLRYLNGDDNTKFNPNENYAREFLELFTIGKGPQLGPGDYTNYTEDDVQEAAKLLTGWIDLNRPMNPDPETIDPDTGLMTGQPDIDRHNTEDKTFSSAFGNEVITGATTVEDMDRELDDFVQMIFDQDETARTICRRLYRFFVSAKITSEIENDIIEPLSATLRTNDYNLEVTLKQLLKSQHFFDADDGNDQDEVIGSLIKSPLEMLCQVINVFQINIVSPNVNPYEHYHQFYKISVMETMFAKAGMSIFEPDTVAGYPAYYQEPGYHRNWLDSSTIIARYKMGEMFVTGKRVINYGDLGGNIKLDVVDFVENSGLIPNPSDAESIVDILTQYLFAYPVSAPRKEFFYNEVFLDELSPINWYFEWLNYKNTGMQTSVKIALENLITNLLFSQEFQLM